MDIKHVHVLWTCISPFGNWCLWSPPMLLSHKDFTQSIKKKGPRMGRPLGFREIPLNCFCPKRGYIFVFLNFSPICMCFILKKIVKNLVFPPDHRDSDAVQDWPERSSFSSCFCSNFGIFHKFYLKCHFGSILGGKFFSPTVCTRAENSSLGLPLFRLGQGVPHPDLRGPNHLPPALTSQEKRDGKNDWKFSILDILVMKIFRQ